MTDKEVKEYRLRCPTFLARLGGDYRDTCMHFGFECGRGWWNPLKHFCGAVERLNAHLMADAGCHFEAEQIKEKYGTIRVHVDLVGAENLDPATEDAVWQMYRTLQDSLEKDCEERCEYCGRNVPLVRTKGWISYLCESCALKTGREYITAER